MGRMVAVANQKGGVGKTTTAINLAAALAERRQQVLLVDLDPQAGATVSLGLNPETAERTTYQILTQGTPASDAIVETTIPGVGLLPSSLDLAAAEVELISDPSWGTVLREALRTARRRHDFLVLDCPPSLGVLTMAALVAADIAIVPTQTEFLPFRALRQLLGVVERARRVNPQLMVRFLRTMHTQRAIHAREVSEELEHAFPGQVYRTIIKRTIRLAESAAAGRPVLLYARNSEAAAAYRALAKEMLDDTRERQG